MPLPIKFTHVLRRLPSVHFLDAPSLRVNSTSVTSVTAAPLSVRWMSAVMLCVPTTLTCLGSPVPPYTYVRHSPMPWPPQSASVVAQWSVWQPLRTKMRTKCHTPHSAIVQEAATLMHDDFAGRVHVFNDGSVLRDRSACTALELEARRPTQYGRCGLLDVYVK